MKPVARFLAAGEDKAAARRHPANGLIAVVLASVSICFCHAGPATSCPVDMYREYNPTSPPQILDAPPVKEIASPYVDTDTAPAGTALAFYRVSTTTDPDPYVRRLFALKAGPDVRLEWNGGPDPAACCTAGVCSMQCRSACEGGGGIYMGEGTTCSDTPAPCDPGSACQSSNPFYGMSKQSGGGTVLSSEGIPATAPVTLMHAANATGQATSDNLTFSVDAERTWNFTGAHDAGTNRYYYIGGDAGSGTLMILDTSSASFAGSAPLDPPSNLVHLGFDHTTGTLFGLRLATGGLTFTAGHYAYTGAIDLVTLSPSGSVTPVASGLPGGLDHYAASIDPIGRRYFYHTMSGDLHKVDLDTGSLETVSVPRTVVDLQYDDETGILYGLLAKGALSFQGSGTNGYRMLGPIELASIDPNTGALTVVPAPDLPPGITNWLSAFDCDAGRYFYTSESGEMQILDAATGSLVATAPPPADGRFHSLD